MTWANLRLEILREDARDPKVAYCVQVLTHIFAGIELCECKTIWYFGWGQISGASRISTVRCRLRTIIPQYLTNHGQSSSGPNDLVYLQPVPLIFQHLATLTCTQQFPDSPRPVRISRRHSSNVERRTLCQVLSTLVIVFMFIHLRIMVREPVANHLLHDLRVRSGVRLVRVVEDLAILEDHFLRTGHALEAGYVSVVPEL